MHTRTHTQPGSGTLGIRRGGTACVWLHTAPQAATPPRPGRSGTECQGQQWRGGHDAAVTFAVSLLWNVEVWTTTRSSREPRRVRHLARGLQGQHTEDHAGPAFVTGTLVLEPRATLRSLTAPMSPCCEDTQATGTARLGAGVLPKRPGRVQPLPHTSPGPRHGT